MNHKELTFYHIYPLGFCGAEPENRTSQEVVHRLSRVTEIVPSLREMGINAVYLGPLFQSESHGYDTIDYQMVDRRLGNQEDLSNLVKVCHEHQIKVVLDCVFNHVSRSHFAFRDLIEKKQQSVYRDWFCNVDFNRNNPCNDGFDYGTWDGFYSLVKLNLTHADVRNYLVNVARQWIDFYDIDGLRMDAADVMDLEFLRTLSHACREKKSDFFMLGEIVKGDYLSLIEKGALNAVTNYEGYKGLYSSLNDRNYFEIAYALNRQFGEEGLFKNKGLLYNFVDNHDVNRVASNLKKEAHLYPLYLLLFTMPGIPSIYYLSEVGERGAKSDGSDAKIRPIFHERNLNHPLYLAICKFSHIRKTSKSLKFGDYQQILVASEQLAFLRSFEDEQVLVLLNASSQVSEIKLPQYLNGMYEDLLNSGTIEVRGSVRVNPNWGCILIKQ